MSLTEILQKLWEYDGQTCPCEMGIPCIYNETNEPCGCNSEVEIDCISGTIPLID